MINKMNHNMKNCREEIMEAGWNSENQIQKKNSQKDEHKKNSHPHLSLEKSLIRNNLLCDMRTVMI